MNTQTHYCSTEIVLNDMITLDFVKTWVWLIKSEGAEQWYGVSKADKKGRMGQGQATGHNLRFYGKIICTVHFLQRNEL